MSTTRVQRLLKAPRDRVYRALLDANAVSIWMVPKGMTSHVHAFDPRPGGAFRISLTYDEAMHAGKTSLRTDTHHGKFVKLVPNERIVQTTEFETADPSLRGEMTITFDLQDAPEGCLLNATHENVPPGVKPEDNDLGWKLSLDKLAALVEDA